MTPARDIWAWLSPLDRWGIALVALGVGLLAWVLQGVEHALTLAGLAALSTAIARIDGARFTIPDLLVLPLAGLGLVDAALAGAPLLPRLLAMGTMGLVLLVLRAAVSAWKRRSALGLGDVKLIAAAAAWLPVDLIPAYIFAAALTGLAEVALRSRLPAAAQPTTPGAGAGAAAAVPVAFGRHLAPWLVFFTLARPWLSAAPISMN